MAVTITKADHMLDTARPYPVDEHGKLRFLNARVVQGAAAGDIGSTMLIGDLPPGRVRIIPWLSRYKGTALGAAPTTEIAHALRDLGAQRVGFELGGQLRAGMAVQDLDLLRQDVEGVDAAPTVWAVRSVKSDAEVERIRHACDITHAAYEEILPRVGPGATERELRGRLLRVMTEQGADGGFAWVASGPGSFDRIDGVPRDRQIADGDLVFFDAGANVGGYWSDYSRTCIAGVATAHQREQHALAVEVTGIGVAAIAPGRSTAEVGRAVDAAMTERGLSFSSEAGRYGHGLGLAVTEPPDLAAGDPAVIEPGMVLTMEPGWWREDGMYHCEEIVVVTMTGTELLTQTRRVLVEAG